MRAQEAVDSIAPLLHFMIDSQMIPAHDTEDEFLARWNGADVMEPGKYWVELKEVEIDGRLFTGIDCRVYRYGPDRETFVFLRAYEDIGTRGGNRRWRAYVGEVYYAPKKGRIATSRGLYAALVRKGAITCSLHS